MKGPRPKDQQSLADPVPPGKFAETQTWVKGYSKRETWQSSWMTCCRLDTSKQPGILEGLGGTWEH
eukprot:12398829-Prorocentrum_lima.AAC.1